MSWRSGIRFADKDMRQHWNLRRFPLWSLAGEQTNNDRAHTVRLFISVSSATQGSHRILQSTPGMPHASARPGCRALFSLRLVTTVMEAGGAAPVLAFARPRRYSGQITSRSNHAPEEK
jgi:hypothetical protein